MNPADPNHSLKAHLKARLASEAPGSSLWPWVPLQPPRLSGCSLALGLSYLGILPLHAHLGSCHGSELSLPRMLRVLAGPGPSHIQLQCTLSWLQGPVHTTAIPVSCEVRVQQNSPAVAPTLPSLPWQYQKTSFTAPHTGHNITDFTFNDHTPHYHTPQH